MVKKTFKEIRTFNSVVDQLFRKNGNFAMTKMGYAIGKISDNQIAKILKEYNEKRDKLFTDMVWKKQVDLALVDKETGAVLKAPEGSDRPFLFDREGLKKTADNETAFQEEWNKQFEVFDNKDFEIDPHYVTDIPKDLTPIEIDALTGFVIEPEGDKVKKAK